MKLLSQGRCCIFVVGSRCVIMSKKGVATLRELLYKKPTIAVECEERWSTPSIEGHAGLHPLLPWRCSQLRSSLKETGNHWSSRHQFHSISGIGNLAPRQHSICILHCTGVGQGFSTSQCDVILRLIVLPELYFRQNRSARVAVSRQ